MILARIRMLAERLDVPVAVLQDLAGPKVRIGTVAGGSIMLEAIVYPETRAVCARQLDTGNCGGVSGLREMLREGEQEGGVGEREFG